MSNSRSDDSRRIAGIFVGEVVLEGDDDDDDINVTLFEPSLDFVDGGVVIVVVVVACEEDFTISR